VEVGVAVPVGSELQVSFSLGVQSAYRLPCKVVRLDEYGANGRRRRFELGLRFQKKARIMKTQLSRLSRRAAAAG